MDRINANVFRQMRDQKHGKKTNDIYAKPKPKNPNQKFTRPTGAYTLNTPVPQQIGTQSTGLVNPNQIHSSPQADVDLYYANPNNYTKDLVTKTSVNKAGVVTRTNGSGITTLQAMVRNPKNPNQPEAYQYKIRTKKVEDPDLDLDMDQLSLKQNQMSNQYLIL